MPAFHNRPEPSLISGMPDKIRTPEVLEQNRKLLRYVKEWLRYRGVSQRAVADALSVSEPSVSKWLQGKQAMSVEQFLALAKLLKASPEELLGEPSASARSTRLQQLAEVAVALSDDKLDTLIATGKAMKP